MKSLFKNISLLCVASAAENHVWDYKVNGADWADKYATCGKKN